MGKLRKAISAFWRKLTMQWSPELPPEPRSMLDWNALIKDNFKVEAVLEQELSGPWAKLFSR